MLANFFNRVDKPRRMIVALINYLPPQYSYWWIKFFCYSPLFGAAFFALVKLLGIVLEPYYPTLDDYILQYFRFIYLEIKSFIFGTIYLSVCEDRYLRRRIASDFIPIHKYICYFFVLNSVVSAIFCIYWCLGALCRAF